MPTIKIIGLLDQTLVDLLESSGYTIRAVTTPDGVNADDIEGLTPVILSDVGRYTARGIERGLQRDVQATQRFIRLDDGSPRATEQSVVGQLQILQDFAAIVSRNLSRDQVLDSAIRFLQYTVGADMAAIHEYRQETGWILVRAAGLDQVQAQRLVDTITGVVDADRAQGLQAIRFERGGPTSENPLAISALVPLRLAGKSLGMISLRLGPQIDLYTESLHTIGRLLALSLMNSELKEESERAIASLAQAQQSMSQAEKLAAVGMLAAGIAHEINNPASFIITNLTVLQEYMDRLMDYTRTLEACLADCPPDAQQAASDRAEQNDIDYLRQDVPDLIARCLAGMRRIHDIVKELRSFAHKGTDEAEWVDINQLISQVLKLAGPELRHRSGLELDLRPLPRVHLESTKLVQVLLNLIINAYQSFGDRSRAENMIWVGSRSESDRVRITVADNGCGIPDEVKGRLFEPFFTTKPVGTGTGLGLAICYELVKNMHGRIGVESTVGRGSRFNVELTLQPAAGGPGLPWRPAESGNGRP